MHVKKENNRKTLFFVKIIEKFCSTMNIYGVRFDASRICFVTKNAGNDGKSDRSHFVRRLDTR